MYVFIGNKKICLMRAVFIGAITIFLVSSANATIAPKYSRCAYLLKLNLKLILDEIVDKDLLVVLSTFNAAEALAVRLEVNKDYEFESRNLTIRERDGKFYSLTLSQKILAVEVLPGTDVIKYIDVLIESEVDAKRLIDILNEGAGGSISSSGVEQMQLFVSATLITK